MTQMELAQERTRICLAVTSTVAALLAAMLPYVPSSMFWPSMFITFFAAGGVYPAAQGIINIALTSSRVMEASVYQVQCNNILFAMPMPYAIGKAMDSWSIGASFRLVALLQAADDSDVLGLPKTPRRRRVDEELSMSKSPDIKLPHRLSLTTTCCPEIEEDNGSDDDGDRADELEVEAQISQDGKAVCWMPS
mgnify:CR=1 FL=1